MNDQSSPQKKKFRSLILGGTALALVLGGGIVGGSLNLVKPTPALADAVQVQGVQLPSFADLVEKVNPAVVSVRVKSQAARAVGRQSGFPVPVPARFADGAVLQAVPPDEPERQRR